MNEWMYEGWAFSAFAPRPTVVYCAYGCEAKYKIICTDLNFVSYPVVVCNAHCSVIKNAVVCKRHVLKLESL
jgi:hypothetical protein